MFSGMMLSSQARVWTDGSELSAQLVSRQDPMFEHGVFRDALQSFDSSIGFIFRALIWIRVVHDSCL